MSLAIVSRSDAGLPISQAEVRPLEYIIGITWHYSIGEERGHPNGAIWWHNIYRYHVFVRNYDDIAYHYGIHMVTGKIYAGRPLPRIGAHSYGYNKGWIGIVFLGDNDPAYKDVQPIAIESARSLTYYLQRRLGKHLIQVPHSQQSAAVGRGTACPGDEIRSMLPFVLYPEVEVMRLAGHDRFETAAMLAQTAYGAGHWSDVWLLRDQSADGQTAAQVNGPILLVTDEIPNGTAEALRRHTPDRINVIGGTVAISTSVVDEAIRLAR